jgi:Ca2+-binding RTX toxin-like protein
MSLTPHRIETGYEDDVFAFIRREEGLVRRVYSDSLGVPTLGVGYALIIKINGEWRLRPTLDADLLSLGITLTVDDRASLETLRRNLNANNGATNKTLVPEPILSYNGTGPYPYQEEQAPNSPPLNTFDFNVLTDDQVRLLYDISVTRARDEMLGRFIANLRSRGVPDPVAAAGDLFIGLDRSKEMEALTSLAFSNSSLIGRNLTAALYYGDRAEAWYNIRYDSNKGGGHANRRYREADQFALYNDGPVSEADAKGAYRMFTRHKATILGVDGEVGGEVGYEDRYSPVTAGSTTIETRLAPAYSLLNQSQYTQGITIAWNHIYVGEDASSKYYRKSDNDFLTGTDENDLLFGESGNDELWGADGRDVLYGGAGVDRLVGGVGDDYLDGGTGSDLYYYYAGNGNDIIADQDGLGRVIYVDAQGATHTLLDGFRLQGTSGPYVSDDARFQYTLNGSVLTVQADGATILTVQNYQTGTLGVALSEHPFDLLDSWTGDASDNYRINVLGLAAGHGGHDYLDSRLAYSAHLLGGEGNDWLVGGETHDRLEGGEGNDYLAGGVGRDRLEGGAGNDLLSAMSDRLYVFDGFMTDWSAAAPTWRWRNFAVTYSPGSGFTGAQEGEFIYTDASGRDWIVGIPLGMSGGASDLTPKTLIGGPETDPGVPDDDFLIGGNGDDYLAGGFGADILIARDGDDSLYGGAGLDYLLGLAGDDFLAGGEGDDVLDGDSAVAYLASSRHGNDTLFGEGGNDTLYGQGGNDYLAGGDGADTLYGDGASLALAEHGNDTLDGGEGADRLYGMGGRDHLLGGGGNDELYGGAGDDTLEGGAGNDWLQGGEGFDNSGNDVLLGGAGMDTLFGEDGNDILEGGDGADELVGGAGADTLVGGAGDDAIWTDGADTVIYRLGDGRDEIYVEGGSATSPRIEIEGANIDQVSLSQITGADGGQWLALAFFPTDRIDLQGGFLDRGQTYVIGGETFTQRALMAYAPALSLNGTTLADTIYGGNRGDTISGGAGSDKIYGQGGMDSIGGGDGDDEVYGEEGNDSLGGNSGNDILDGGDGNDILYGDTYGQPAGNDTLLGGAGDDRLYAYGGNDRLDGGAGVDMLYGYEGADTYVFGRGYGQDYVWEGDSVTPGSIDTIELAPGILFADVSLHRDGSDLILALDQSPTQLRVYSHFNSSGTYDTDIERVVFADGTVWDEAGIAARTIAGMPNAMTGTAGDDVFTVDDFNDTVSEAPDQGTDTVESSVTYTLPANVENLTLTGFVNLDATGNELNNTIRGNAGNNVLRGGNGYDLLQGGAGDDIYRIRESGDSYYDRVEELPGEGIDSVYVYSVSSYTLPDNVENLYAINNWLNGSFGLTGNALDNLIVGEDGNDYLDGGAGADILIGGWGDDTYVVDNPNDRIIDEQGNDTVRVLGSLTGAYALSQYPYVENLDLSFASGAVDLIGDDGRNTLIGTGETNRVTGGGGDDILAGLGGDDVLDGGAGNDQLDGGSGADTLIGGSGDDIYSVDDPADVVIENANEGIDSVRVKGVASGTYSLARFANVENLDLSAAAGAADLVGDDGNNTLVGNASANVLTGGAGDDRLEGREGSDTLDGGGGNDTLIGGTGADLYRFGRGGGQDVITDQDTNIANVDVIEFAADVIPNDLLLSQTGSDLTIAIRGTSDALTVRNYYLASANQIEQLRFAGGTVWGTAAIAARVAGNNANLPSEADDTLGGTLGDDTIAALGGNDTLSGEDGNDTLDGGDGSDTLFGNAGDDTIQGGAGDDRLWGLDGNDTLTGGDGDDLLVGGNGDDVFDGGAGNDTLGLNSANFTDGAGNDTYRFGRGAGQDWVYDLDGTAGNRDVIVFAADIAPGDVQVSRSGLDLVFSINGTTDTLTVFQFLDDRRIYEIEEARFADGTVWDAATLRNMASAIIGTDGADTLNGTDSDDRIYGLGGNDTLNGNAGNDLLDGGPGADTMNGGSGNDIYIVDNASDVTTESSSTGGNDTVLSSVTRTLGSNFENLTLTGSAAINGTGNTLANVITGNEANNSLSGSSGNDTLYGMGGNDSLNGGTGADTMAGGAGDDTYTVDNTGDVVIEQPGQGVDKVNSSITYTLTAEVENLTLTGTSAINGTGNDLDNILTGNSANNTLNGGAGNDWIDGGSGSDTMVGGAGNDTYVVNVSGDIVTENAAEGTDTVRSGITYTLGANVENLTLTGTSAINGTGNSLDNVLTGNSANNTLTGNAGNDYLDGGTGSDTLRGGLGDDTYVVNSTGDIVTENANEGVDTVRSSITYTLGSNVENLTLTGTTAINGTGNSLDNVLTGNGANNTLTGNAGADTLDGGAGNDTLNGGAGNDSYLFNRGYGQDTVSDNDATAGNQDTASMGVNPLDLVFTRSGNNLVMSLHGGPDSLTVSSWYSGTQYHTEVIRAADGRQLLNTQVDQLIQAMAQFSADNGGITWDQAIDQRPQEVAAVLAAYWQPSA